MLSGLVATLYIDSDGIQRGHHVVREFDENNGRVLGELCAEHTVDLCVSCGRAKAQHYYWKVPDSVFSDEKPVVAEDFPDCEAFVPHPPCLCAKDRWENNVE